MKRQSKKSLFWECDVLSKGEKIGKYEVVSYIGKGGFGAVYEAKDRKTGGFVAIKIFAGTDFISPESNHAMARIEHEAEIMRQFADPALPRYIGSGKHKQRPYIVMESLMSLSGQGYEGLPVGEASIREFAWELLESTKALHALGYVHCDIKPKNIMQRAEDGRRVLIDFGSAHKIEDGFAIADANTISKIGDKRVVPTSCGYGAPEQGTIHNIPVDIYALGVVFRDCFEAAVPLAWSSVINRCTSRNPGYRYASTDELQSDVMRIDELGRDEMTRRLFDLQVRRLREQSAIATLKPTTMSWLRMNELIKKSVKHPEFKCTAQETLIRFADIGMKSIALTEPVEFKGEKFIVIDGPGILKANLSAAKNAKVTVILGDGATLINTSPVGAADPDMNYFVGKSCYLNFSSIKSDVAVDLKRIRLSTSGYSFVRNGGPRDISQLIERVSNEVRKETSNFTAAEFFGKGKDSLRTYLLRSSWLLHEMGLPTK